MPKRKEALRNQVGLRLCRHWPKQDTDFVEEEKMKEGMLRRLATLQ